MKSRRYKLPLIALSLSLALPAFSQSWFTPEVEKRAEDILKNMTVKERLTYIGGIDWMYTRAIPRLNVPAIKMSDGPQGVGTWGASTAYPCDLLLAATWNPDMAYAFGAALAQDCKARGVNILLGPAVNIARAPFCGRNFEYMGEDPFLTATTSTGYIKGLQENGVMGVIKHFTANFQEYDRNYVSSNIDERTLHEIYFPAFKSAVQNAEVGAVMSSYNLLNGVWTTENPWLLKEVLREQWGFNGLVMSDWGSTHNCVPAVKNGLDLEMAGNEIENEEALRHYLETGEINMSEIDLKVKHILQTMIGFGFFDKEQLDPSIPLDNPETAKAALEISREGIVLLKNESNILPLNANTIKNIAVIGNNATIYAAGGGSGLVRPFHYVSYFDGLKKLANEKGINVTLVDLYDHMEDILYTAAGSNEHGLKAEFYNNENLSGTPVTTRIDSRINFEWTSGPDAANVEKNYFSVKWTGEIRPEETSNYTFIVKGDDGFRLILDGKTVIDEFKSGSTREKRYTMKMEAGKAYKIQLDYFQGGGGACIDLAWLKDGDENRFQNELDKADIIVAFIGHNSSSEAEAGERSFGLPQDVKDLVLAAQKSSKPMIGVVNAGGNVEMQDWEPKMKGLLWGWYGGQEAGTAMAEVLFGEYNPSGKLPVTFEKRWEDNPCYNSYYDNGTKQVNFTEGIMMGYRGYDKAGTEVQYPFGFGLSYTTFNLSDMQITESSDDKYLVEVSCKIKNTGKVAGAEVIQLYVGKNGSSPVERPIRELKGYQKVYLEPEEEKFVTLYLSKDAFSYYDVNRKNFVVDNGEYNIELGFSSRDIKLKDQTQINVVSAIDEARQDTEKGNLIPSVVKQGEIIRIAQGCASELNIFDLTGQMLLKQIDKCTIDTSYLKKGAYLALYKIDEKFHTGKFIVE